MRTLGEIQSRLITIGQLLDDKQSCPLNSWHRRRLLGEYKILQWVIQEVDFVE